MCHVGLIQDNQPVVIPTMYARDGDAVIIHGSTESRLMQYAGSGQPLCLTVTAIGCLGIWHEVAEPARK